MERSLMKENWSDEKHDGKKCVNPHARVVMHEGTKDVAKEEAYSSHKNEEWS